MSGTSIIAQISMPLSNAYNYRATQEYASKKFSKVNQFSIVVDNQRKFQISCNMAVVPTKAKFGYCLSISLVRMSFFCFITSVSQREFC